MPFHSQQPEKIPDHALPPKDPFVDSIQSVSRQNSLPFWLDRSWIPAETEYPTDDEDGKGLLGFRYSTPRVLVYDWAQKALDIRPLDAYKYPNGSDSTYRPFHDSDLEPRQDYNSYPRRAPSPTQPFLSIMLTTDADEKLLFSKIPFHLWTKPLKLCIERRPKGTSQCAPRYRVTNSKEIPSDMMLLSIIPLNELRIGVKFGILLRQIKWIFIRNFPQTSDTRNMSRKK